MSGENITNDIKILFTENITEFGVTLLKYTY